jgi:hypothetical protein
MPPPKTEQVERAERGQAMRRRDGAQAAGAVFGGSSPSARIGER